jgi:hypothetical protein
MANDAFVALAHLTRREIVERLYIATGVPQAPDDVSSERTGAAGDHPDAKPIAKRRVKPRVANDHRSPVMASFFSPENYTLDVWGYASSPRSASAGRSPLLVS